MILVMDCVTVCMLVLWASGIFVLESVYASKAHRSPGLASGQASLYAVQTCMYVQAVKWLSNSLADAQMLVTLLRVINTQVTAVNQQQPSPPPHVHARLAAAMPPMTALLQKACQALALDCGQKLPLLAEVRSLA